MQLNLFEDITNKQMATEYVTRHIIQSDSIRDRIKQAIKDNDRNKLIKLFQESINTFGFGIPDGYSWHSGTVEDKPSNKSYKVTARELADTALEIYGE